jgi:hypothetical protein
MQGTQKSQKEKEDTEMNSDFFCVFIFFSVLSALHLSVFTKYAQFP